MPSSSTYTQNRSFPSHTQKAHNPREHKPFQNPPNRQIPFFPSLCNPPLLHWLPKKLNPKIDGPDKGALSDCNGIFQHLSPPMRTNISQYLVQAGGEANWSKIFHAN